VPPLSGTCPETVRKVLFVQSPIPYVKYEVRFFFPTAQLYLPPSGLLLLLVFHLRASGIFWRSLHRYLYKPPVSLLSDNARPVHSHASEELSSSLSQRR